ncbi:MAG TPA: hypothetical protein VJ722_00765 [Rhodanobacteraceae bacterium]|nr:hypothetical protein [Rhodanobacteraceae bacterium]
MLALAASALFAGGASAAVNPDAMHLALDSLLVATTKMAVVNAMNKNGKPPANNAEAHLGAPETMTTTEISKIVVSDGGVINIYLAPVTGTANGLVQLVPKVVKDPKGNAVGFVCNSPNIPEIAKVSPSCTYVPRQ